MRKSRTAKKAGKNGEKRRRNSLLTPTVIQPKASRSRKTQPKRGVKAAGEELDRLIDLANLAGGADLPYQFFDFIGDGDNELLDKVIELPEPPKAHLLELMNRPEQWRITPEQLIDGGWNPEYARRDCQAHAIRERYNLIRGAKQTLDSVVRGESHFPATVFIIRGEDHKASYAVDEITRPLIGVDLRDIAKCAVCEKFFFKRRATSVVCEPDSPCADTYAKRQERLNKKRREEVALKQKRASKRRTSAR